MPSDEEGRADGFYSGVLGFEILEKPPALAARGGRWYGAGEVHVHLGVDADFRPAKKAHPALVIDDLDRLVEQLGAAGIDVVWDVNQPGVRRCFVDDPFGNRIELIASG